MLLTEDQLKTVEDRILRSGLKHEQLHLDLTDHISCMTEEHMDKGDSFEKAIGKAFQSFPDRHIKQLEHTTNILTMETMKRHTKIIGIIGLGLTILGSTFKIMHLPGAAALLGIGVLVLGFGFFSSNARDTMRNLGTTKGKAVQVLGAIGAFLTLFGGLFKVLHLPGAGIMLMAGPFLLLLYFSFSSFLRTKMVE